MIVGRVQDITEAQFQALITNRTGESPTLDFKQELPSRGEAGRHEFCADISAFANATGGDLVYGISEDDEGRASGVLPLVLNPDQEPLRFLDLALNGVEPRISGLEVRAVPVSGGHILIVRVPNSWNAPHRVRTNQHFFIREGARKRQLDMPEIRNAFLRAANQTEEVARFRLERVAKILAAKPPMDKLVTAPLAVVHIVPLAPTVDRSAIDPRAYYTERRLPTLGGGGGYPKINLDGALRTEPADIGIISYTQIFRNGRVEAVKAFTSLSDGKPYVPSTAFEKDLLSFYEPMLTELAYFNAGPPIAFFLSLLRVHGVRFAARGEREWGEGPSHFDRDDVLLPDIVIEDEVRAEIALRPALDLLWQSVGFPCSHNFDEQGNWTR